MRFLLCLVMLAAPLAVWPDEPVPANFLIEGVPFIGYHDVRDAAYPGSDVINPSLTAVAQIMYGYWGEDFIASARAKSLPAGWTTSSGDQASLDDLKSLLARGIPVQVAPATTPDAHRLYSTPKLCAVITPVSYERPRPASGSLGELVSHRAVEQLREGGCGVGLNDSVFLTSKLLIGYDDERRIFTMHDPSFGPQLELGYDEFSRMWAVTEAKYWARHPDVVPPESIRPATAVRARTNDDEAAVALFRAYGLNVSGRYAESESTIREALALEGLGAGRRHLLQLELAVSLNETGRCAEAIEAAREAQASFGDYALAHSVLANLLACSDDKAARNEAKRELKRATDLCSVKAQRRVADELGRDFHVMGCKGELLGWYRP
ncbi:MAG: hypothetical protein OEW35_13305 [Gammaproteobacteria bacterium]|nr:hypothetical protein [Gammaproteobacteria bacterium]